MGYAANADSHHRTNQMFSWIVDAHTQISTGAAVTERATALRRSMISFRVERPSGALQMTAEPQRHVDTNNCFGASPLVFLGFLSQNNADINYPGAFALYTSPDHCLRLRHNELHG